MSKKIKCIGLLAAGVFTSTAAWSGCNFSWTSYGDNKIKHYVEQSIGGKIPDSFCPYAKTYKIVLVFDAFAGAQGCQGYAAASLTKKTSSKAPVRRKSRMHTNGSCTSIDTAQVISAEAAVAAVGDLMSDLDNEIKAANELN